MAKGTFGWKTLTAERKPSYLEGDGRTVTAMIRTSGVEAGWTYLTARLDPARVVVVVLGPQGELLGYEAAEDGEATYLGARSQARHLLDGGEAA